MIVAHLDLDAFFAAVEELENPAPAHGSPDRRRRPARPRRRRDRELRGALVRDPLGDVGRGGAPPLPARGVRPAAPHAVPRLLAGGLVDGPRDRPDGRAGGDRRGLPRPRKRRGRFDDARAVAEAVRAVVRARTQLSCSLGVATSKVVAKVASDRRKPGGLTVVRPGREAAFLAPFPIRLLPGVGPKAEERLRAFGIETIGQLAAIGDGDLAGVLRGKVGRELRDRARGHRPTAARGVGRADLDLAGGDVLP